MGFYWILYSYKILKVFGTLFQKGSVLLCNIVWHNNNIEKVMVYILQTYLIKIGRL